MDLLKAHIFTKIQRLVLKNTFDSKKQKRKGAISVGNGTELTGSLRLVLLDSHWIGLDTFKWSVESTAGVCSPNVLRIWYVSGHQTNGASLGRERELWWARILLRLTPSSANNTSNWIKRRGTVLEHRKIDLSEKQGSMIFWSRKENIARRDICFSGMVCLPGQILDSWTATG